MGVVFAEVVVALGIADPRFLRLLFPVAGALALAFVFASPFTAACGVIVLFGSVELGSLRAGLGPIDVRAYELLLGALLLVAIVRPVRVTWGGRVGAALAIFLALLTVAALTAVSAGAVAPTDALAWSRPFFLYSLFFVIVRLFPEREQVTRLLTVGAVCAAVSGVVAALIATNSGLGQALDFGAGFNTGKGEDTIGGGAERVQLPGLGLAYVLFWFALFRLVSARGLPRLGWSLVLGGMTLNIIVSQTRNYWLGLIIGLAMILVLSGTGVRQRLVTGGAVLILGLALMFSVGTGIENDPRVRPVISRGTSLFNPQAVESERSLTSRTYENGLALESVKKNLLIGIGPGTDFGMSFGLKRPNGTFQSATQRFLHNQYLYLIMVGGVPTILAFLAFLGFSLLRAARGFDRDPTQIALAVGVSTIMISALVWIVFASYETIGAIALLTGAMSALAVSRRDVDLIP